MKEELVLNRLNFDGQTSDTAPATPAEIFSDRMTLDMGDTTFELYYVGGMHSASDIFILVPELGLLMTGDTMADVWLTDTPGCLASFMARPGVRHDFPLLLENWGLVLEKKDRIKLLVPGHWNGELTMKGFEERVSYVRALWEGVNSAVREGKSLAQVQTEYRLDTRFPELASSPGFSRRNTYSTVLEIWDGVTGQKSAAEAVFGLVDEGAAEEAIRQVLADRDAKTPKYYFLEDQFNAYGYRFLQENRVDQAIALFKLNVQLFPASWNVYDSLGEALLKAGDTAASVTMYEKSVALNPENTNGKDALARIRAVASGT